MNKYIYIFALAIGLLFLSSCGKSKEQTCEKKFSELNNSKVDKANNSDKKTSPVHIKPNLNERGVIITVNLIANKNIDYKDIFAEIITERNADCKFVDALISRKCKGNKITFPPIKKGLKKLKIKVKAKGFAESFSDYFDTAHGDESITVNVNLLPSVKFRGRVIRNDGIAITNLYFRATPCGLYEKRGNPGHFNKNILTDNDGYFEIDSLLPEYYKFNLKASDVHPITTNAALFSDEDNYIEFILPKLEHRTLKGIVIYEKSGEPASGVEVVYKRGNNKTKAVTDESGHFIIDDVIKEDRYSRLIVNEPEFAPVNMGIHQYNGELITIKLIETGILTGKITTEAGIPIPGVIVRIRPNYYRQSSEASFQLRDHRFEDLLSYANKSEPSDVNGIYVISNAAAPLVYTSSIYGHKNYFCKNNYQTKIPINPGKTTIRNFTLYDRPTVLLKVIDEDGCPITSYRLKTKIKFDGSANYHTRNILLANENDWYEINVIPEEGNANLFLTVETDSSDKIAELYNVPIKPGKEYKFILVLSNSVSPDVSGFICNENLDPVVNHYMSACFQDNNESAKTDYLGFFEITGLNSDKNKKIKLSTYYKNNYFVTNVCAKSIIEWVLPNPKQIIGKVYVGDIYLPATNYSIKIGSRISKFKTESFSLPVSDDNLKFLFVEFFADGYAPEIKKFNWDTDSNTLDVGNIIIKNKPAEINGKVIDYDGYPVKAKVALITICDNKSKKILTADVDDKNGKFQFKNLPIGIYYVEAHTHSFNLQSEKFRLHSDEIYTVPDLVIVNTNKLEVMFRFVLPDGSPAANAQIVHFNSTTDKDGVLFKKILPGNYNKWRVEIGDNVFHSAAFKIDNYTEDVTVNLIQIPLIKGTVTLNGKPLDRTVLYFWGSEDIFSASSFAGKFELNAKPGKYIVTCVNKGVAAIVELSESNENKINFTSGNSSFEFVFSVKGRWDVNLSTKIDNKYINIASYNSSRDSENKITGLSAGEYKIYAYCRKDNFSTNAFIKTTLNSGETKKLTF